MRLGIDFGTSSTVAVLRGPDGRVDTLLFDGSPVLPSAVFAGVDGALLTGRDALFSSRSAPERFEPNPKLRVDDGTVLLGAEVAVVDLFAAVLRRVVAEARATAPFDEAVLTHPAGWGTHRQSVLSEAASRAGLGPVRLLPEPVAAASGADGPVLVYDLGAGTFDVALVADGRVLAADGLLGVGGLDIDAAVIEHIAAAGRDRDPAVWERLANPSTRDERQARRQFTDDVRVAKELLSRSAQTHLHVPGLEDDTLLTRDELEHIARPLLARTIAVTRATAGADAPGRILLVGGGSRMPLVATMLHQALGVAPVVGAQPELAVAQGAVLHEPGPTAFVPPPPPVTILVAPPVVPAAPEKRPTLRTLRILAAVLALTAVLALAFSVRALLDIPREGDPNPSAEVLAEAESAAEAILSYDYRSYDDAKNSALDHLTGEFADTFATQMEQLEPQVVEASAIVTAAVVSKAVVSSSDEAVTVLLFVNVTRQGDNIDEGTVDQNRLEFTLVPVDGTWKVSEVTAL